jgi:hypothetical protein
MSLLPAARRVSRKIVPPGADGNALVAIDTVPGRLSLGVQLLSFLE